LVSKQLVEFQLADGSKVVLETDAAGSQRIANSGDGVVKAQERFEAVAARIRPAAAFGLYEMHGNVSEWVQDCYHQDYSGAPIDGSAWLAQGKGDCSFRVLRGGSWIIDPRFLRSANRDGGTVDGAVFYVGFRLARTL
jgi:formylglycine-generating enzyme required for sulfatase activity